MPPACGTRRGKTLGTFVAKVCLTSAVPDVANCAHNGDGSRMAHPVAISTLEALLAAGIDRRRENGELVVDADPARLAAGLTTALQGGSLLARTPGTSPGCRSRSTWR